MNKFSIFFCLLFLINVSNQIQIEQIISPIIYDKLLLIIKGMSNPDKQNCYTITKNYKDGILASISEISPGQSFFDIFQIFMRFLPLSVTTSLLSDCKVLYLLNLYEDFSNDDKRIELVETLGGNINRNSLQFFEGSSNFVKVRGLDAKLVLLGKVLGAITDIKFD